MYDWKKFFVGDDWGKMYRAATAIRGDRSVSEHIQAGAVAAAVMAENGKIYTGVCIDTACSLGMCAERAALAAMISDGQDSAKKLICVMQDDRCGYPCGACIEFMMQLGGNPGEIEIMTDYQSRTVVKLKELMPHWWAKG